MAVAFPAQSYAYAALAFRLLLFLKACVRCARETLDEARGPVIDITHFYSEELAVQGMRFARVAIFLIFDAE